jgi:formamidopyrimidine-DNA glycosylase
VPELPEVEALAAFLRAQVVGDVVAGVDVATINVLKTFDPPVTALAGLAVTGCRRHGKFLDVDVDGVHLVLHLARAGWLRWVAPTGTPPAPAKPGKGPLALRVRLASGARLDCTEAGTQKRLAAYVVRDAGEVPGVASLGPDPLDEGFDAATLDAVLEAAGNAQLKGVLTDQRRMAGVGNAYSDEILHTAGLSPFRGAAALRPEERARLLEALRGVLTEAVARAADLPAHELKDAKRAGMRVHGRTGKPCPVCGDVVREVSFADSSLQYCATCQTGGTPLADRRLSRLLR